MSLWDKLIGGIRRMLGRDVIEKVLSVKPAMSADMINQIQLWSEMYEGRAPWLKEPNVAEGQFDRVVSLGLPALIASEKARMATLEMESEITPPMKDVEKKNPDYEPPSVDEATGMVNMGRESMMITEPEPDGPVERAVFMNKHYQKLLKQVRRQIEYGIAKGGIVIKPYPIIYDTGSTTPTDTTKEEAERLSADKTLDKYSFGFDFVQADRFYPLSFDSNGHLTEVAFLATHVDNNKIYTRLEHHHLVNRVLTVHNYAFVRTDTNGMLKGIIQNANDLGKPCSLEEVEEWANLEEEVKIDNVEKLLFGYFKMPEANTIDPYSPLGVSAYSRVVSLIKDADEQYSRMLWEFEGGELAIDVDRDALKINEFSNGHYQTTMPTRQQRLFRKVDLNSEETYEVFSPALRDESLSHGLNVILTRIEDVVGFSRGTISEASDVTAKTATELKIEKQRSYATNRDIQFALEDALRDTVYAMDVYCKLYKMTPPGEYQMSFEWDDSIIVDTEVELEKRMAMINAGITSKLETRMWYFGETENQAKAALQKVEDEKKQSMETNIQAQAQLGDVAQGKDFSGDNNNPDAKAKQSAFNKAEETAASKTKSANK